MSVYAGGWDVEFVGLARVLGAHVWVDSLADLVLVHLGGAVVGVTAMYIDVFLGLLFGLAFGAASWEWTFGETDLAVMFDNLDLVFGFTLSWVVLWFLLWLTRFI